jgi:hypothetical protein
MRRRVYEVRKYTMRLPTTHGDHHYVTHTPIKATMTVRFRSLTIHGASSTFIPHPATTNFLSSSPLESQEVCRVV